MKIALYPKYLLRSLFVHGRSSFFTAGYKLLYPECGRQKMTPWKHYVIEGKSKGFDNGNNPSDSVFYSEGYKLEYPDVKVAGVDPWKHYAETGKSEGRDNGLHPNEEIFFCNGYLEMYPDVLKAKADPWRHFVEVGKAEGRDNGLHPGNNKFFAEGYLEMYPDVAKAKADPWRHYVLQGKKEGRDNGLHPSENTFFAKGYLEMYPDVAKAKVDPWRHYILQGKKEGRTCCSLEGAKAYYGIEANRANKNILIVSYKAARTGVPILSLNLMKSLASAYNIYSICLSGGELLDDIINSSCFTMVVDRKYIFNSAAIKAFFDNYFKDYNFEFAIVNSACASFFLKLSFEYDIPSVLLVHEFSYYTSPDLYRNFMLADDVIFSSEFIKQSFIRQYGLLPSSTNVIPQGDPKIISQSSDEDRTEENWKSFIRSKSKVCRVVAGLGTRSFRKGVDLFLLSASEIQKKIDNVFFIWIGDTIVEEEIPHWDLDFKIDALNLRNKFAFIPNLKCLNEVFVCFHLVLLTARLDPLPNVIIGAMRNSIPFLSFDGVSGICDILKKNGLEKLCLARYLDSYGLADKACVLLSNQKLYDKVSDVLKCIYNKEFLFESYVKKLLNEAAYAKSNHAQLLERANGILHKKFLYLDTATVSSSKSGLQYVLNCQNKPYPGFLPVADEDNRTIKSYDLIEKQKNNYESMDGQHMPYEHISLKVAIHIHAYYVDELLNIIQRIMLNKCCHDVFFLVSTTNQNFDAVNEIFSKNKLRCLVRISENKGRDYGPFFTLFNDCISSFDIIGHIHTKKSLGVDRQHVELWKDALLSSLIGCDDKASSINMLDRNLTYMENHREVGLLFPDHPRVCGWNLNRSAAQSLVKRLNVSLPDVTSVNQFIFPVGSMFFARYDAVKNFFVLTNDDFPPEPVPYDGTILHAIERLLPFVCKLNNYKNACVYVKSHSMVRYNI